MNLFLNDSDCRAALVPFSLTRHVSEIRVGILTIKEKWERLLNCPVQTEASFTDSKTIVVPANIIPCWATADMIISSIKNNIPLYQHEDIKILNHPWHIFQLNDWAIRQDFDLMKGGRISAAIAGSCQSIEPGNIFIEEGARLSHCILNASAGPIYIGKNAEIMEGATIRGPFSLGENAVIKMGSRVYGATTIGPHCVAGGEIKNAVMFGHSNKAHDGYLGDSVIGEWCNLGAGTSNSNVKNTGGEVRYQISLNAGTVAAGNKAGLLMGDYSRSAINTSFNTGTVVGVCCNIFGEMPGKYVPDFSWGKERYIFEKAVSDINNWKKMKGKTLSEKEEQLLRELYLNNQ